MEALGYEPAALPDLGTGNDTLAISKGQEVTITYTGLLPDSTVIDGLQDSGGELTFVFGHPDQVIEGLEVAVSLLHDGGSGRFLIPSELAFGALGGGAGSVPPNMPSIMRWRCFVWCVVRMDLP